MFNIQIAQTQNIICCKKARIYTIGFPNSPTILPATRTTRAMTIHNNIMPNILAHKRTIMQINVITLVVTLMLTTINRSHTTTTNKCVLTTKTTTHRPRIILTNPQSLILTKTHNTQKLRFISQKTTSLTTHPLKTRAPPNKNNTTIQIPKPYTVNKISTWQTIRTTIQSRNIIKAEAPTLF